MILIDPTDTRAPVRRSHVGYRPCAQSMPRATPRANSSSRSQARWPKVAPEPEWWLAVLYCIVNDSLSAYRTFSRRHEPSVDYSPFGKGAFENISLTIHVKELLWWSGGCEGLDGGLGKPLVPYR
jgi:hypothetical protein